MGIASELFWRSNNPTPTLDTRIRPSEEQSESQTEYWNHLRDYLVNELNTQTGCRISSWLQGSYKFGTQVRPYEKGKEFDIDLGIYFNWPGEPDDGDFGPSELKILVHEALEDYQANKDNDAHTVSDEKMRCSRIHYNDDFHIDVPSYHLEPNEDLRSLATMNDEWEPSDPKAIYVWWKNNFTDAERSIARRMVRYLKMWAALNIKDDERPSSIVLTVLVANALGIIRPFEEEQDDDLMIDVVLEIQSCLNNSYVIRNPVDNNENLNRLSEDANDNLLEHIQTLIDNGQRAQASSTKVEAAENWAESFSHFFPIPEEGEVIEESMAKAVAYMKFVPIISIKATNQKMGKLFAYTGINSIGPIPRDCSIEFSLSNAADLPHGAEVYWTVRNDGNEAYGENDLGHRTGPSLTAKEHSEYRGTHYMDVSVKIGRQMIGRKRVPVVIEGELRIKQRMRRPRLPRSK